MDTATTSTIPRCGFCEKPGNLQVCGGCKVIQYCDRAHQEAHRPTHKAACKSIAKAKTLLDDEEQQLRDHPGGFMMTPDPFTTGVGHFWGIHETRPYMRARWAFVDAMRKVKTRRSVQAQLDNIVDMIRLCRSENLGLRYSVPSLFLLLNEDQKAYDFVKWYRVEGQRSDYDWGDMDLPFLDVKDADVFETPDIFCTKYLDPSFTIAVTILKIKLLLDLKNLQNSKLLSSKVPTEMLDHIQVELLRSHITRSKEILELSSHEDMIEKLSRQVNELYVAVDRNNKHYWSALMHPHSHLTAKPEAYSSGSREEMQMVLQSSYDAWIETPGAIDYIKELRQARQG